MIFTQKKLAQNSQCVIFGIQHRTPKLIQMENNSKRLTNKGHAITFVKHSQLLYRLMIILILFYFILFIFLVVPLSSLLWIWIEMEFERREKHTDFYGFSILHQSVTIVLDYNLDR